MKVSSIQLSTTHLLNLICGPIILIHGETPLASRKLLGGAVFTRLKVVFRRSQEKNLGLKYVAFVVTVGNSEIMTKPQ